MRHTLNLVVENREGALSRIARLFDGRGYRLESLTTSPSADPDTDSMTLVINGAQAAIEKIERQLEKLIDVVSVEVRAETSL